MSQQEPAEGRIDTSELLNSKSRRRFLASLGTVGALGIAGCSSSSGDSSGGSDGSDGTEETELKIKEETKATIRLVPVEENPEPGKCIYSGKPSKQRVVFARAY